MWQYKLGSYIQKLIDQGKKFNFEKKSKVNLGNYPKEIINKHL